jgi:hypothetical protein
MIHSIHNNRYRPHVVICGGACNGSTSGKPPRGSIRVTWPFVFCQAVIRAHTTRFVHYHNYTVCRYPQRLEIDALPDCRSKRTERSGQAWIWRHKLSRTQHHRPSYGSDLETGPAACLLRWSRLYITVLCYNYRKFHILWTRSMLAYFI